MLDKGITYTYYFVPASIPENEKQKAVRDIARYFAELRRQGANVFPLEAVSPDELADLGNGVNPILVRFLDAEISGLARVTMSHLSGTRGIFQHRHDAHMALAPKPSHKNSVEKPNFADKPQTKIAKNKPKAQSKTTRSLAVNAALAARTEACTIYIEPITLKRDAEGEDVVALRAEKIATAITPFRYAREKGYRCQIFFDDEQVSLEQALERDRISMVKNHVRIRLQRELDVSRGARSTERAWLKGTIQKMKIGRANIYVEVTEPDRQNER